MDSFLSSNNQSNSNTSSTDIEEPKRKKPRIQQQNEQQVFNHRSKEQHHQNAAKRWKTESVQRIYSSKLIQAIRHVRRSSVDKGGKEMRETADRILALSAKSDTRWCRAILASPISLRPKKRQVKVKVNGNSRLRMKTELKRKKLPAVEKKLRVLSRLIPGCRKVSFVNVLEEVSDYIAALEMQVRAMTALSDILAGTQPVGDRHGSSVSS